MNNSFFTNKKHEDFIEDFEDKWLQYATEEEKMKAYFGTENKALELFEKWESGEDVWETRKNIFWGLSKLSNKY